jgi:acetyltransferase-like isoleucine patch superfamily enzyme
VICHRSIFVPHQGCRILSRRLFFGCVDHVHLCPGVHLAGGVQVGSGTMIGTGVVVLPGIQIGKGCVVGAGAVVNRDLPNGVVAFGVPAKIQRGRKAGT